MNAARSFQVHGSPRLAPLSPAVAESRPIRWLEQENGRLARENESLRQLCADLSASAELWIGLYESALARLGKARP
jgi:hypothetical protein